MTAATLSRAAALMRERAEAATPGPWEGGERCVWSFSNGPDGYVVTDGESGDGGAFSDANAAHIASWHPAVALAVADWLDRCAADHESDSGNPTVDNFFTAFDTAPDVAALTVARAFLGEQP